MNTYNLKMSIDSCYEEIIARLTRRGKIVEISKRLALITDNAERTLAVVDIIKDLDCFPNVLKVVKSEDVSTYYRNLGNSCFKVQDDYLALQYYNLAMLHAPLNSETFSLALANRSAVFASLRKYVECLDDINKVLEMKFPERLKEKLEHRQELCRSELANQVAIQEEHEIKRILAMQSEFNSRYLSASSKLNVVFTEELGRHVVANEDLQVGEVLAIEDPYFTILLKSQFLFSCNYCLSRKLNLWPCDSCCYVLYCSFECKQKAWKDYHQVECVLMPTLLHMNFTKLELLALRTVIKARTDHLDWPALYETITEAEGHMGTEFRGHILVNDEWVFDSKYYASIHTLATNVEKRSISDIFQKAVTAAVFFKMLDDETHLLNCETEEEVDDIKKCVAGLLLLHVMTSPTNMHGIRSTVQMSNGHYVEEISIASAPYAFHSLLNHSCAPNVVRFNCLGTGKMTLFALRPIKKGMQLFDNYGSHHALEDRASRQNALKTQYKFDCVCEACTGNWPMYLKLGPAKRLPRKIRKQKEDLLDNEAMEKLKRGDKSTALKVFKTLCSLAEALEPYAPCVELADVQETLKQCLIIFEGLLPRCYCQLVEWEAVPIINRI